MTDPIASATAYLEDRPALSPAVSRVLWIVAPLIIAAGAYWFSHQFAFERPEGLTLDWRLRARTPHSIPPNILLVEIDEASRRELRSAESAFDLRAHLATAIDRLSDAGALAIGLDIWFEDAGKPESDRALANAISRSNVVLAVTHTDGKIKRPLKMFLDAQPREGVITVYSDANNTLRSFPPSLYLNALSDDGQKIETIPHFPVMLAWFAVQEKNPEATIEFVQEVARIGDKEARANELIDFTAVPIKTPQPSNPWKAITLQTAVRGALDPKMVDGTLVIIGESRSIQDAFMMPLSESLVPGIYYHANAIAHILRDTHFDDLWIQPQKRALLSGLLAFVAGIVAWNPMSWWKRRSSTWLLATYIGGAVILFIGGWIWVCFAAFRNYIVLPVTAPLLAMAIALTLGVIAQWIILTANARRLEERNRRIEMLFGQSVSERMLDALRQNPEGVRQIQTRDVSVLFCDVRNFTTSSEHLAPEVTAAMLNEYFDFITTAVFENDGFLDKFIGDEIMAVFSVPFEQADHPLRAVQTAVAIKQKLNEYNRLRGERGLSPVNCGLGIHCGPAAAGHIGSSRRSNYTVVGTTVNIAARIEAFTRDGEILISESVRERLPDNYAARPWRKVELRGLRGEHQLYEVQVT